MPAATPVSPRGNRVATCSLVFGLISVITMCAGPLCMPFAMTAIVCGVQGIGRAKQGAHHKLRAVVGLTLGIIALSMAVFFFAFLIFANGR